MKNTYSYEEKEIIRDLISSSAKSLDDPFILNEAAAHGFTRSQLMADLGHKYPMWFIGMELTCASVDRWNFGTYEQPFFEDGSDVDVEFYDEIERSWQGIKNEDSYLGYVARKWDEYVNAGVLVLK